MRHTLCLFIMLVWSGAASAQGFSMIADRDTFLISLQGRKISQLGLWMRFDSLGQVKGRVWGRPLIGNWEWTGQKLCHRIFHGTKFLGEDCVAVRTNGTTVLFVPAKGEGKIEKFRIE